MSPLPICRTIWKSPAVTRAPVRPDVADLIACQDKSDDRCGFKVRLSGEFDLADRSSRASKDNRLKLGQLSLLIELWLEFRASELVSSLSESRRNSNILRLIPGYELCSI
ncbi:hypothetical protein LguiB_033846 [Lonicera macranthoides]